MRSVLAPAPIPMLNRCNKNVIIMGDVNINTSSNQYSPLLHPYLETLYSNGFTRCINNPTRIASSSQTAIDHIITNIIRDEITPGILKFHISNHLPIFCSISSLSYAPPIIQHIPILVMLKKMNFAMTYTIL